MPRLARTLGLAACLTTALPTWAGEALQGLGAYADLAMEAASNGMPIVAIDGDWAKGYRPRSGVQRAYETARAELGFRFNPGWDGLETPWAMGVLARADATALLSGPAAQVLYHYQSRTDPAAPQGFDANARIHYWVGRGLTLHAPTLNWGGLRLDLAWDHMTLTRQRSMQTWGQADYNQDGSYSYRLKVRDDSWRTTTMFMDPPRPSGVGNAVSVGLSWRHAGPARQGWSAAWPSWGALRVDDAWSQLQWRGLIGNDADVNSRVAQKTPDGRIDYQAAIQGQYTRRTLEARIPVTAGLQVGWSRPEGDWSVQIKHRVGIWQSWLAWQSPGPVRWQVGVEPAAQALRLGVTWQGLSAQLMSDKLDSASHLRGGQLSWGRDF